MSENPGRLTAKSVKILQAIAEGRSYEQILRFYPSFTCNDIFSAARDALELLESPPSDTAARDAPERVESRRGDKADRLHAIKQKYPRAYEKWSKDEDTQLRRLVAAGREEKVIAAMMQRQPSAIRSGMSKLGLPDSTRSS